MSGVPYIGAKISLISRSEIRYEGILAEVDPKESTIGLENVMMMGTENRKPHHEYVPMNPQIYDFILFRSTDIKDLQVCEVPQMPHPVAPSHHGYVDPAIMNQPQQQQYQPPQQHQYQQEQHYAPQQPKLQFGSGRSPAIEASYGSPSSQTSSGLKFGSGPSFAQPPAPVQKPVPQSEQAPQLQPQQPQQIQQVLPKVHPAVAGNVVSLTPKADQKVEKPVTSKPEPAKVLTYSTGTKKQEFVEDRGQFAAPPPKGSYASIAGHGARPATATRVSLERPGKFRAPIEPTAGFHNQFSMTQSTESAQGKLSEAQEEVFRQLSGGNFYEKSSFFDNISCDARDGSDQIRNDHNLNMETFGVAAPPRTSYNYRGRGRGGYRGGSRGGYRGGYRGGKSQHQETS